MPGFHISDQQVFLFMTHRRQHTQAVAAAKAGISERSARRIEKDPRLPSQRKKGRHWRTRTDPLEPFWPRIEELLQIDGIIAVTIFETLQDEFGEDAVPDAIRRTLERRIARWRALHGGEKEIFFPQHHEPGRQGLSDFTVCDSLKVTVAGEPLAYRLFHFRLAASGWEHAAVVLGGESFAALSEHLQDALWKLGGAPAEHRSDSLSAAYKNLDADAQRDFTRSYDELCRHYGMLATRNNRGEAHENGSIEGPHAHLKRRLDQALRRRGSRDFVSIEAWREFVEAQVARQNRRHAARIDAERRVLKALPARRTTDFAMVTVDVTRNGTVAIDRVTYSVPSRLVGRRLNAHLFDDRIELFLGPDRVMSTPRVRISHPHRGHSIDFRHMIGNLRRKPGALRNLVYREALFPDHAYRRAWQAFDAQLDGRQACRDAVALLDIAARGDCVGVLARRIDEALDSGRLPDVDALQGRVLANRKIAARCHYPATRPAQLQQPDRQRGGALMTRTKDQAAAVLPTLLKALRLPSINRNWKRLTDTADRDGWPAANLLASLLEIEMADRSSRRIQRHREQSGLPAGKTFATFDFDAAPGIRKPHLLSLAAGDNWIESGGNLLLFGQSGTGKTHAVAAIGHALIDTGRRVLFCSTTDMVQKLQAARRDLSLPAMLDKLDKFDLIVLDDLSYVRKDQVETSALFELIAHRYERHSLAITANQPFSAWDNVFPDPAMTVAAIDRLVHHSTIIEMNGESYRKRSAVARINAGDYDPPNGAPDRPS